jgi:hypothetical protein
MKLFYDHNHQTGSSGLPTEEADATRPSREDSDKTVLSSSTQRSSALDYLDKVKAKINNLADEYASGTINRTQFKKLYSHYQREIRTISTIIMESPEDWTDVATEGKSILIRREYSAKAHAYVIYENSSGIPIYTIGKFTFDPDLLVPMLSTYRSATTEIFGGGIRTMQIEDGSYVCFVAGVVTTMIAMFNNEPSGKQLDFLGELHETFERANHNQLEQSPINFEALIYPHEFHLGKWKKSANPDS